jgi:hypothetical protein
MMASEARPSGTLLALTLPYIYVHPANPDMEVIEMAKKKSEFLVRLDKKFGMQSLRCNSCFTRFRASSAFHRFCRTCQLQYEPGLVIAL